jgi:hypothetical protein
MSVGNTSGFRLLDDLLNKLIRLWVDKLNSLSFYLYEDFAVPKYKLGVLKITGPSTKQGSVYATTT